jgi:hypothetical protein
MSADFASLKNAFIAETAGAQRFGPGSSGTVPTMLHDWSSMM